jgi:hypothetical protein
VQNLRLGGRQSKSQYQYVVQGLDRPGLERRVWRIWSEVMPSACALSVSTVTLAWSAAFCRSLVTTATRSSPNSTRA